MYEYIIPEDACRILKITNRTLYNWDSKGLLKSVKTKGGHRRYMRTDVLEEIYVTVESQPEVKKKIWKDKLSSLDVNTLIMKLSLIMDQALTSKEKVLTPF
jgi:excisionase family DNA binding protein